MHDNVSECETVITSYFAATIIWIVYELNHAVLYTSIHGDLSIYPIMFDNVMYIQLINRVLQRHTNYDIVF